MDNLLDSLANLDEDKTLLLVREAVESGASALDIVEQCRLGVEIVGRKYNEGEYYLSDLIMSEEILRRVMEVVEPYFARNVKNNGIKVVIGTIEGDIHDLGKNIIVHLLRSVGFDVFDLGVDVAPAEFVRCVRETGASIMGISVLLTFSVISIKKVMQLLEEEGLRDKVTVVLGGYPVDERVKDFTGADYCEKDALKAVELIKRITM